MKGSSRRHTRIWAAVATIPMIVTLATGCADAAPTPRAVTTEESQLLAITRFANFDAGTRSFTSTFTDAGHELTLEGWFDYRTGVGYGALLDDGEPNSLLTWETHTLAIHAPTGDSAILPPPDVDDTPGAPWALGPLDPTRSTLHAALILIGELGRDRPENPLLLQQGRATWRGADTVNGIEVTVFGGPTGLSDGESAVDHQTSGPEPRLRYWIGDDGVMHRVEAVLGQQPVSVDFGPGDDVDLDYDVQVSP